MLDLSYMPESAVVNGKMDQQLVRHFEALGHPETLFETAIAHGIRQWILYASAHRLKYGSDIGSDPYAREYWKDWGQGIRGLLNCETGRLSAGTLDHIIRENLEEQGFNTDLERWKQ